MKVIAVAVLGFCVLISANPSQSTVSYSPSGEKQWEYLTVSFGKTEFGSPEKLLAYRPLGIADGLESTTLQSSLDVLGRFGWEFAGILGAVGGDQQIMLKREYSKERSSNEHETIEAERAEYFEALQDLLERRVLAARQAKDVPRLVDLDELAENAKKERLLKKLEVYYKARFDKEELTENATILVAQEAGLGTTSIDFEAELPNTFLIDGNGYHGQEIRSRLKSCLENIRFKHASIGEYADVSITIRAYILFGGEKVLVSKVTAYKRMSSDWLML